MAAAWPAAVGGRYLPEVVVARWVRAGRAGASPLDLLLAGDFGAFEDALGRRLDEAA